MYSLVLMTAMSAAPDTSGNGFFRNLFSRNNCEGCCGGCSGATRYSGTGCSGYSDYASCNGCCGGSRGFLGLGLFSRSSSGCCGGSYACSGYSCGGAVAYGGYSSPAVSYTPVFNGGLTRYDGPIPSAPPPVFAMAPAAPAQAYTAAAPQNTDPNRTGFRPAGYADAPGVTTSAGATARGTVIIRVPADARLFADNTALRMTGTDRTFVTPPLATDMEYTYRFRAEYDRDGETISVTKRVAVRPGRTVAVEFTDLVARGGSNPTGTTVSNPAPRTDPASLPVTPVAPPAAKPDAVAPAPAADRATITVKLPPGATLYVDNQKGPGASPVREFSTPPLPAGREFAYLMKAEVVRDGRPEYVLQKVSFRAGDRITVDFTAEPGR
jgi:uncharacterized protein (TIGR03000 family)